MSKANDIRDALANGPLTFRKLHEKVGGDDAQLKKACSNLEYNGWITIGKDEDKTVTLKSRRGAAQGKKPARKKSVRKSGKLTMRKIAERVKQTPPAEQFRNIILDNLVAAGAELRAAIKEQVEGLEDDNILLTALAHQERAEQIYQASRNA